MLQLPSEASQPLLRFGSERMVGIDGHFDGQTPQAVDDRLRQPLIEAGEPHDPARPLVDHLADKVFVGIQRAAGPGHDGVKQRYVPLFRDRRLQRLPKQRRYFERPHPVRHRTFHHPTEPLLVERLEQIGNEAQAALAEATFAGRGGEKAADGACHIDAPHPPRDHGCRQKIVAKELRQRLPDSILVLGDDRRVRDRKAERMPEQSRDGEPVGKPADHGSFGKRPDKAPAWVSRLEAGSREENGGHRHQHAGRNDAHPAGAALRRVESVEAGPLEQAHPWINGRTGLWFTPLGRAAAYRPARRPW